ncbi:MAG: SWF/SNF helicase family protein, partial [Bacteroidetes bacterium]|nr:SWF/SNF helicase family protein [Bacteroidota bacterium]
KLVIFSESKETVEELSSKLKEIGETKILTVSAENRKTLESIIRKNFDANLEEKDRADKFNIIITTEVLAEGINLHRSNIIVNYDVPWNSTRLMQRIGRVNRIGTKASKIHVYNFYPSAHGDQQINLVNTALRKLQAFHSAFGEDNKIFSLMEEKGEGALFGSEIQREESEILKYLNELRDFKKKDPKLFKQISKLPNKARCGRDSDEENALVLKTADGGEQKYPLNESSLAYLKSDNHPGIFCFITPDFNCLEISFLQAVKIYEANRREKPVKLHDLHYEQTSKSLEFFKSEKNQDNIQNISKKNLSPAENKAITNLRSALKQINTEQKKKVLNRTMELIRKGAFASKGLPKSVNDYFKKNASLMSNSELFIDGLFKDVLDRFDLSTRIESDEIKLSPRGIINPKIVLTQSFK